MVQFCDATGRFHIVTQRRIDASVNHFHQTALIYSDLVIPKICINNRSKVYIDRSKRDYWWCTYYVKCLVWINEKEVMSSSYSLLIVRRAGLLWSQQDFEWRWSVPLFKCLTVSEFSFILFDLCLLITFFNFIMNYVPIVTFWIFTYHKIWILSIMFCFIWSYWIIYFLACLEVSWRVVS